MSNKIVTGIWLVFFGLIFLLDNFHIIDFNFFSIIKFWPVLLVSMGVNLLFQNRPYNKYVIIGINTLLCVFIFYKGITTPSDFKSNFVERYGDVFEDNIVVDGKPGQEYSKTVSTDYNPIIKEAHLVINGGAAKYSLIPNSDQSKLISGTTNNNNFQLNLSSSTKEAEKAMLSLNSTIKGNNKSNNNVELKLNQAPVWNFEFNLGAAAVNGDLRTFKIKSLELNSGASKMELTLPVPKSGTSEIEINTAASKIRLEIPKGTPCRVEYDSIISNNNLEDIDQKDGDVRKSEGYDVASDRYNIKISGAANSLTILRY